MVRSRRPRAARLERRAGRSSSRTSPLVAVQHRQPLRGVLVPREPRRRPGHGRARLLDGRAGDRPGVASRGGGRRTRAGRWEEKLLAAAPYARALAAIRAASPGDADARAPTSPLGRSARREPDRLLRGSASRRTSPTRCTGCTPRRSPGRAFGDRGRVVGAGQPGLAARASRSRPPRRGCGSAVQRRRSRLPDGSLFLPIRRLDAGERLTSGHRARERELLELVAPYAFASGLFAAGQCRGEGRRCLPALTAHACLGLVRAGATPCTARCDAPASGTDQVYGVNAARFLAAERPARPARAQPLRPARRRDDAERSRRARPQASRPSTGDCATARCTCRRTASRTTPSSRRSGRCCSTRREARRATARSAARLRDPARLAAPGAEDLVRARRPASARSRSRSPPEQRL